MRHHHQRPEERHDPRPRRRPVPGRRVPARQAGQGRRLRAHHAARTSAPAPWSTAPSAAGEKVERAMIDKREMQFLYRDGDDYVFMDNEHLRPAQRAPGVARRRRRTTWSRRPTAVLQMYGDEIVGVELPAAVELTIAETEPGIQGDRVSGARKPATLETGLVVQVPLFVEPRRPRQGRHPHRRVPHPGLSPAASASGRSRREARERALGLLYEAETKGAAPPTPSLADAAARPRRRSPSSWCTGVERAPRRDRRAHRPATPGTGRSTACRRSTGPCCAWASTSWRTGPTCPPASCISEAVELAKRYSTDDSRPLRQRRALRHRRRGPPRWRSRSPTRRWLTATVALRALVPRGRSGAGSRRGPMPPCRPLVLGHRRGDRSRRARALDRRRRRLPPGRPGPGPGHRDSTDGVVGEVGLGLVQWAHQRAAVGFWIDAEHRRNSLAAKGLPPPGRLGPRRAPAADPGRRSLQREPRLRLDPGRRRLHPRHRTPRPSKPGSSAPSRFWLLPLLSHERDDQNGISPGGQRRSDVALLGSTPDREAGPVRPARTGRTAGLAERERRLTPPYGGVFVARTQVMTAEDIQRAALADGPRDHRAQPRASTSVVLVGLQTGGVAARRGAWPRRSSEIDEADACPSARLDVAFYRDDIGLRPVLPEAVTDIPVDLDGAHRGAGRRRALHRPHHPGRARRPHRLRPAPGGAARR